MIHQYPLRAAGAAAAALGLTLATACGGGEGSGDGDSDVVQVWTLDDEVLNAIVDESLEEFSEEHDDVEFERVEFVNDAYKERLHVAMDTSEHPDVFFNWGGGNLGQYVDAGLVWDMSEAMDENPEFRDSFLDSVLEVGQWEGGQYGIPAMGVQPVSFFYNAEVFDEVGVDEPETYDELMDVVADIQAHDDDLVPIVLPGAATWTNLMWVSYLTDRIGGADAYGAISAGEEGAWEDPAVIETMEEIQRLVDDGAFGPNFASLDWDGGEATAVLGEGQGAMMLMGPWLMQDAVDNATELLESGNLGYFEFPEMTDGGGEPGNVVGPPSNFFSIHAESEHAEISMEWMTSFLADDEYAQHLVENRAVPPLEGIEDMLTDVEEERDAEFNQWLYSLVQDAPNFTPAWDQDLDPGVADEMLTNFGVVFDGGMTPEEFAEQMEAASN